MGTIKLNTMKTYSGVGSRETPRQWLSAMTRVAGKLEDADYVLRSGGADGADKAFQDGVTTRMMEIYIPWNGFNDLSEADDCVIAGACAQALNMAESIHPAWERCSRGARALHARNCYQVLGHDLQSPSDMLLCWTPGGLDVGGTATAIRLARSHDIPVYNFGDKAQVNAFHKKFAQILV